MRNLKSNLVLFVVIILFASCKQQQARMPISHSSGEFLKASAERNIKLIKGEENKIDST